MRLSRAFAVMAVLLLTLRLFTGIVYEEDDPTVFLVLKHTPALFITTVNPADRNAHADYTVLMDDENIFPSQDRYEALMHWAPALAAACAVLAWLTRRRNP